MNDRARERRFYALLAIGVFVVAAVALTRVIIDAVAAPVTPRALVIALDDRAKLERAQRYNRRLEKILRREVSRAERHERTIVRERRAARRALGTSPIGNHWLEDAFLCLYQYERGAAGWGTATGNGYEGGLQFDRDFQLAHGRQYFRKFGAAYNWPQSVQIAVAIDAWITRGFSPWPNTRKRCGL